MSILKFLVSSVALSGLFSAGAAMAGDGDPVHGEEQFKKHCSACHNVMKGATPDIYGVVLPLYGIVGRESANTKGFFYSKAMRESGVVWTKEMLDKYIENPKGMIPGIRMEYAGLEDAKSRADIIAFLISNMESQEKTDAKE